MKTLYEDPKIANLKSYLKKARVSHGYTQEQLAELTEVNIKSIAAYEQDPKKLYNAGYGTVHRIASCLGCDTEDIINPEFLSKE